MKTLKFEKVPNKNLIPYGDELLPRALVIAVELLEQYGEPLVLAGAEWAVKKGMNLDRAASALQTALPNWSSEIKEPQPAGTTQEQDNQIDVSELIAQLEAMNAEKIPN